MGDRLESPNTMELEWLAVNRDMRSLGDRTRAAVLVAVANDYSAKATEARIASEAVPRRVSVACADTLKGQPIDC